MRSDASSPTEYLEGLPPERREVVAEVRALVQGHVPPGYRESVNWGMLSWEVPLERYPDTYNGQPLGYVALAAQKNHYALYLHGVYMDEEKAAALRSAYAAAGKKLDMGKSCVRFRKMEDLVPEALGEAIAAMGVDDFILTYEAAQGARRRR